MNVFTRNTYPICSNCTLGYLNCEILEDANDMDNAQDDVVLNNHCRHWCQYVLFLDYEYACIAESGQQVEVGLGSESDGQGKYYIPLAAELEVDITLYSNHIIVFICATEGEIIMKK